MKMAAPRFHEVFSPTIMETTVSNKFLNIINETSDGVLSDKKKSIELVTGEIHHGKSTRIYFGTFKFANINVVNSSLFRRPNCYG